MEIFWSLTAATKHRVDATECNLSSSGEGVESAPSLIFHWHWMTQPLQTAGSCGYALSHVIESRIHTVFLNSQWTPAVFKHIRAVRDCKEEIGLQVTVMWVSVCGTFAWAVTVNPCWVTVNNTKRVTLHKCLHLKTACCWFSDYSVHDFGDLNFRHLENDEPYMDVKFPRNVGAANKMLSGAVSRAVGAGHTLVMLGGDHR